MNDPNDFLDDYKDILKKANDPKNAWDFFDSWGRDELAVKDVVKYMVEGFEDIYENNLEYMDDQGLSGSKYLIKEAGYDFNEVQELFPDEVEEIFMACEGNYNFNIGSVMPSDMFLYSPVEFEIQDISSRDEEYEAEDEDLWDWKRHALMFGFSTKDIDEVYQNASYGGAGGIGIIVEGSAIAKCIMEDKAKIGGNVILYIRDSMNGSGHYVLGSKYLDIDYKNLKNMANNVDYGNYSLGDVFGTGDWSWK
jgi:hypothetical protein